MMLPGSCNRIRQKWLELVPLIIAAAKLMKNLKIKRLLAEPRFDGLDEDIGTDHITI